MGIKIPVDYACIYSNSCSSGARERHFFGRNPFVVFRADLAEIDKLVRKVNPVTVHTCVIVIVLLLL